jgi:glycosyltransferase involved in cell wall biosynthesis
LKVLMISKTMMVEAYHAPLYRLSKLGVELTVVAPPKWGTQKIEDIRPTEYEMLVMKSRLAGARLKRHANHLHYYPDISKVIGRQSWDLVHIDEEPFNFVSYHAMRSLRGELPPVIFTTWQNLMKRYPPPFNLFESRAFERSCGAIAGNTETLDVLRRRGFEKPTAVISHGIDPEIFRRQDADRLRRKLGIDGLFAVGYMGRIIPEKGLDVLIRAMALLPNDSVLVLRGNGPSRGELEGLIESLGLEKRVRWMPWVHSGDVPECMNAFDVLALPSRTTRSWKEQFGRVLIEAMACETCVVGSDSGEIPITIGEGGLIFPEGDEEELADRLRTLMGDSTLRESLGRNGRERVLQHYTHERIALDTASFYEQVCRS